MKTYYGFYLGIVVQNNDPEKRGRIKIWVPHISAVLRENWNSQIKDKNFIFPDQTTNPDLITVMPKLKEILPWAECAAPLFGGSSSARFNAKTQTGTTSDSNHWENNQLVPGARPVQFYTDDNPYPDAFTTTNNVKNRFTNPYAYQYIPSDYSNSARGLFTIPNVGAHVWVFFIEGNPNVPVYFAASYGQEDWKKIYTQVDYQATYENKSNKENADLTNAEIFRAKTVFNSNKHTIELIDTDNNEVLKLTHFSGSFKEFNNFTNIELAAKNDQKLVVGDQFLTVKKNQSVYIAENQELITGGDQYLTIGQTKYTDVNKVVSILRSIHEFKKLFDIQRAQSGEPPNDVSILQKRVGKFAVCPVCGGLKYTPNFGLINGPWQSALAYDDYLSLDVTAQVFGGMISPVTFESLDLGDFEEIIGETAYYKGSLCDVCKGSGYSPSTQDGQWTTPDPYKAAGGEMDRFILEKVPELTQIEKLLGEGDQIVNISKNKVENIGLVVNDFKSFRVDPIGKLRIDGVHVALEGVYATFKTSPHVEYVDVDDVPGGDYNLTVANKFKILVGAKGINMKTFGPIDIYGTIVNLVGEQINISSQNEVFIDGGERFSIRARKIALIPFEHNPVAIEGQLHVTRNAIIGGGMLIEGELGVNHITAPYAYYQTLPNLFVTGPVTPTSTGTVPEHTHTMIPHFHVYKNLPMTLVPAQEAMRDYMISYGINSTASIAAAQPIGGLRSFNAEEFNAFKENAEAVAIEFLGGPVIEKTYTANLDPGYALNTLYKIKYCLESDSTQCCTVAFNILHDETGAFTGHEGPWIEED